MNGRVFVDTNVFIYMQSIDDEVKRKIGISVINEYECCASTQVLNEISNVLLKKYKMSVNNVKQFISAINRKCDISLITIDTVKKALDLKEKYGYSYYDCLILASAILSECNYVFSEDLCKGQFIDGSLKIVNVFEAKS